MRGHHFNLVKLFEMQIYNFIDIHAMVLKTNSSTLEYRKQTDTFNLCLKY
jgi:hypothetical protein